MISQISRQVGFGITFAHGDHVLGSDLLAAAESRLDFVPVADLRLAPLPAKEHPAAFVGGGKIDEPVFQASGWEAQSAVANLPGDEFVQFVDSCCRRRRVAR